MASSTKFQQKKVAYIKKAHVKLGQLDLESSIRAYERGTALRQHCAEKLRQVQLRVEKLTLDRDGNARLQPFEAQ